MTGERIKYMIERSCLSKRSFKKDKVDKIIDKFAAKGILTYYYKCEFCSSYHITKSPPSGEFKKNLYFELV